MTEDSELLMRVAAGLAFALAGAMPALAQHRNTFICAEEVSVRLAEQTNLDSSPTRLLTNRTFSIVWNRDTLNLIYAGGQEYYECQPVYPRLNEGKPRNAIKCQNGVYFIVFEFRTYNLVRAQLHPEDKTDVGVSYAKCNPL